MQSICVTIEPEKRQSGQSTLRDIPPRQCNLILTGKHARRRTIPMKTVIGICPLWDETKDSLWMIPGYMNMLEEQ